MGDVEIDDKTPLGPNVKRLMIERASQIMVERAESVPGPFGKACGVAVRMMADGGECLKSDMREAFEWTKNAIALVRSAPDCDWETAEEIAGEILRRMEERRQK